MKKLSHTSASGKAKMVDIGNKPNQERIAKASGFIKLQQETLQLIRENKIKKGDVLTVAEIAGIQAAKNTAQLIPLCHPLILTKIEVTCTIKETGIQTESLVKTTGKTGVEMEALQAVSTALLTIYDMCKAVDKEMEITGIHLIEKIKK